MKIYNLNIDTSKPIRQVLSVPTNTEKYGIVVKVTAGDMNVANPVCQLIDGANTLVPKKLDDGSFLFEMSSGSTPSIHDVIFHVVNMDEVDFGDGVANFFVPYGSHVNNTKLRRITQNGNIVWYQYLSDNGEDYLAYSDNDKIIFTAPTEIGHTVTIRDERGRIKSKWEAIATVPAGSYYPRQLTKIIFPKLFLRPADCNVSVTLREVRNAVPDGEKNDTIENITLDGVSYAPTTLSVDGVEYKVLASIVTNEGE